MLGTPPAFVLSQDQTLKKLYLKSEDLKSFFESFALANFTQEFSLAVFNRSKTLKQSIIIVQGVIVCLTLFNLQGTGAHAVSLLILTHQFPFVKNFFLLFSNFFFCAGLSEAPPQKPCVF